MNQELYIYRPSVYRDRQYQGEILTNFIQPIPIMGDELEIDERTHPFVLILTQDCDLKSDYEDRKANDFADNMESNRFLPSILLLELHAAHVYEQRINNAGIWKKVLQNRDIRYQYLCEVKPEWDLKGEGIPSLVGDFKRYFSVRTSYVYDLWKDNRIERRCILNPLYLEEVTTRFAHFLSRIATPIPHHQRQ